MKKMLFVGLLAAMLMIPAIATAETVDEVVALTPPRDVEGEVEEGAPVNWSNLRYRTVTPVRCFNTQTSLGIVFGGTRVDADLQALCGIPWPAAKAVHGNMAVFNAGGPGNLRAYAFGDPLPFAATLNYGQIPGLFAISNAAIIPLCGQLSCSYDISFWVSRTCNFIFDAMGYFY
jgi:hypothetical protein